MFGAYLMMVASEYGIFGYLSFILPFYLSTNTYYTSLVCTQKAQSIIPPLEGHTGKILCSAQYKNFILTGSFDMSIAVWDASVRLFSLYFFIVSILINGQRKQTYRLVQELRGQHIDGVCCLLVVGNNLWSGSLDQDGSICVWSVTDSS